MKDLPEYSMNLDVAYDESAWSFEVGCRGPPCPRCFVSSLLLSKESTEYLPSAFRFSVARYLARGETKRDPKLQSWTHFLRRPMVGCYAVCCRLLWYWQWGLAVGSGSWVWLWVCYCFEKRSEYVCRIIIPAYITSKQSFSFEDRNKMLCNIVSQWNRCGEHPNQNGTSGVDTFSYCLVPWTKWVQRVMRRKHA